MTNSFQAVFVMSFLHSYSTESGKEVAKIAGWAVSQGIMDELFLYRCNPEKEGGLA
jgi:hypothetical protein